MSDRVDFSSIIAAVGGYDDEYVKASCGSAANAVEILVKKRLTLSERKRFIDGVVDMCFVEDPYGEMLYCPYLKNFSVAYHTALFFSNIDLGDDIEEVCKFLEETSIVYVITSAVGTEYISVLMKDVDEMIEYRKAEILKKSKIDTVLESAKKVIDAFDKKFEGESGEAIMKYLEEIIPNFKEEIEKVFQEQQELKSAKKKTAKK